MAASKLTVKGEDELAEQLITLALRNNVSIHEESELVQLLANVDLGEEIPETLYLTVAEIIAFVYLLKGKIPDNSVVEP